MSKKNFSVSHGFYTPTNSNYYFHCHEAYEIYMFIEGDSKYVVEEKNYHLHPDDIIVIRKHEMHRVWHNSNKTYARITISVSPDFFKENDCENYERIFLEKKTNLGNKISAETVHSSGLYGAIMRFKEYTENFCDLDSPISKSSLIEILYHLNKMSSFEHPDDIEKPIKKIIDYINNHFTTDITLDFLCEKFFISKYYLCRIFKAHTGLTVQKYIKEKRLTYFEELRKSGKLLTEAALLAGFNDYSVFYRTYVKKYGVSPEKIKNKTAEN